IPRRKDRRPGAQVMPVTGNWYGTTIRVYDPALDAWRIYWIDPATNVYRQQIGRKVGNDIVQEGTIESGALSRWSFTEIRVDSFHWKGEASLDKGASWKLIVDVCARRRPGAETCSALARPETIESSPNRSGRREHSARRRIGRQPRVDFRPRVRERRIALEHGNHPIGEEPHVDLRLLVRHAAERELGDQVVEPGQAMEFAHLLQAVVRRADDLDADVEVAGLVPIALVLHLRVRLGHLAVELVTLDGGEVAVREVIVAVDRVPFTGEVLHAPLARFLAAFAARDIGQDDRRPRRVTDGARDLT